MSNPPKGPISRPPPPRTLDLDGTPSSEALPFDSQDGSSSVPPPPEHAIEDEPTFVQAEARMTAAMPIVDVPDLTPNWAHGQPHAPADESTAALEPGEERIAIPVPSPQRRRAREIDLETYAALRATLDCRPDDESDVLKQADLRPEEWSETKERWEDLIAATSREGDETHLVRFDRAYVQRLDEEREEPYALEDFARFEAATEKGQGNATLEDQKIPLAAKMPLRRQWLRAIMADDLLRSRYYAEVDKARG